MRSVVVRFAWQEVSRLKACLGRSDFHVFATEPLSTDDATAGRSTAIHNPAGGACDSPNLLPFV